MDSTRLSTYISLFERELFDRVIPFWERHSPDRLHKGYFNCLDRDGACYDTTKHIWLQGRQTWMFSKLYNTVEAKPEWLEMATLGADFLRAHAIGSDGRAFFALSRTGEPVWQQRKIFSECFIIMALAEYSRAVRDERIMAEAMDLFERVWEWSGDLTKVGRPHYSGATPSHSLAVPMILLNLIEEVAAEDWKRFEPQVAECIRRMLLHVHTDRQLVFETVTPDGAFINSPEGRLLNPGHAIEAGWFLQNWAQRIQDPGLSATAGDMVRWSLEKGWDSEHGGIFYFLDSEGFSPTQLEWDMKLWWPHCEAMVATLKNYTVSGDPADWASFENVVRYTFDHFPDPEFGEWYGYLNRRGEVTHRFKGGPYKGCFHVPRALYLCWKMLQELSDSAA